MTRIVYSDLAVFVEEAPKTLSNPIARLGTVIWKDSQGYCRVYIRTVIIRSGENGTGEPCVHEYDTLCWSGPSAQIADAQPYVDAKQQEIRNALMASAQILDGVVSGEHMQVRLRE